MKRLIAFTISLFLLLSFVIPSVAESVGDFGYSFTDFLTLLTMVSDFDVSDYGVSDFTFDTDSNYVYFEFNDYSFMLYINPSTRNICQVALFFPQSKISDNAYDWGYMTGKIVGKLIPSMTIDSFSDIGNELGLHSDDIILSSETYKKSKFINGYRYTFSVVPDNDLLVFSVACTDVPDNECVVSTADAQTLLDTMIESGTLDVDAFFSYDESTDLNGTFGEASSYGSKVNFASASINPSAVSNSQLSVDDGGSIEVFYNTNDLLNRVTFLNQIGYFSSSFGCVTIWKDNYLLRLSNSMDSSVVATYVSAFYSAMSTK